MFIKRTPAREPATSEARHRNERERDKYRQTTSSVKSATYTLCTYTLCPASDGFSHTRAKTPKRENEREKKTLANPYHQSQALPCPPACDCFGQRETASDREPTQIFAKPSHQRNALYTLRCKRTRSIIAESKTPKTNKILRNKTMPSANGINAIIPLLQGWP